MRRSDWVPPIVWMAGILALSTDSGSSQHTGGFVLPALRFIWPGATLPLLETVHAVIRKLAHVTEYAVLGSLWYRAFAGRRPPKVAVALALGLSVAWAIVDEAFQTLIPSRTASIVDVGIDAAGALLACVGAVDRPRLVDIMTSALLWTAAVIGSVALVLNAVIGDGSGALWVTTSAAALAVVARRRAMSS
jgi:VanZ family protein